MISKIVWRSTLESSASGKGKVKRRKKLVQHQEHNGDEMAWKKKLRFVRIVSLPLAAFIVAIRRKEKEIATILLLTFAR